MSETITLQEIAGYLPYGLQCQYTGEGILSNPVIMSVNASNQTISVHEALTGDFKPLVVPVSDFTKEDFKQMGYGIYSEYMVIEIIQKIQSRKICLDDYQYLLSHHYDVHGWIERGLAVNKSEYLKTIR